MREAWEFDADLDFEESTDVLLTSRARRVKTFERCSNEEECSSTHWLDWAQSGEKKIEDFS